MDSLPTEILISIITFIPTAEISKFCFVCRRFYAVGNRYRYKLLWAVDSSPKYIDGHREILTRYPDLQETIKQVTLSLAGPEYEHEIKAFWRAFARLLDLTPRLDLLLIQCGHNFDSTLDALARYINANLLPGTIRFLVPAGFTSLTIIRIHQNSYWLVRLPYRQIISLMLLPNLKEMVIDSKLQNTILLPKTNKRELPVLSFPHQGKSSCQLFSIAANWIDLFPLCSVLESTKALKHLFIATFERRRVVDYTAFLKPSKTHLQTLYLSTILHDPDDDTTLSLHKFTSLKQLCLPIYFLIPNVVLNNFLEKSFTLMDVLPPWITTLCIDCTTDAMTGLSFHGREYALKIIVDELVEQPNSFPHLQILIIMDVSLDCEDNLDDDSQGAAYLRAHATARGLHVEWIKSASNCEKLVKYWEDSIWLDKILNQRRRGV